MLKNDRTLMSIVRLQANANNRHVKRFVYHFGLVLHFEMNKRI